MPRILPAKLCSQVRGAMPLYRALLRDGRPSKKRQSKPASSEHREADKDAALQRGSHQAAPLQHLPGIQRIAPAITHIVDRQHDEKIMVPGYRDQGGAESR